MATTATLGTSGIVFNGDPDEFGCRWGWNGDDQNPMGAKPAPREETGDRGNADGQWDATRFYGPRNREIAGEVDAPSHEALHIAEQRLRDAVDVASFRLLLTEPGVGDWFQVVRQAGELRWTEYPNGTSAAYSIGLYAPDPLAYAVADVAFSLRFPSVSGGLVWPATWPATWNATVVSGMATLTNPSRMPLPVRFRLTGPVASAQVANPTTGEALQLARPDGLPLLTAGEYLDVDTGTHRVTLLDTASRRSWAYGDWLTIPPGTSQLNLTGTGDPAATLTGAFTPARL